MLASSTTSECALNENFMLKSDAAFIKVQDTPTIWLGLLPPDSNWVIYGRAKFTLLHNSSVQVFGAHIKNASSLTLDVYSPSTHAPIDVKIPSDRGSLSSASLPILVSEIADVTKLSSEHLWDRLNNLTTHSVDLLRVSAAVLLQPLSCPVIDSITQMRCFKKLFFPPNWGYVSEKLAIRGDTYSFELAFVDEGFIESSEMSHFFEKIISLNNARSPKILVCGPANSGKSTLIRRLINRLLSSGGTEAVAVLDFDPGQSEFTPSGMLSLTLVRNFVLGPPFSHPLHGLFRPIRQVAQCFYGGTSPSVNPSFYVECLRYVFEDFKECIEAPYPVIINTMGWTQGLGLTLLTEQVVLTKPDVIVQLYQTGPRGNPRLNLPVLAPEFLRNAKGWYYVDLSMEVFDHEVILIPSKSRCGPGGFTSSQDQRDLTLLGHLLSDLVGAETSLPGSGLCGRGELPLGHPTAHLLDCVPYTMPLAVSSGTPEVARSLAVHLLHQPTGDTDAALYCLPTLANCLNATLVALCAVPQETIIPPTEPGGLTLLSHVPPCECLGLAVVRAFDPDLGLVYLTTGVPLEKLANVNAIIRGKVNLPQSIFTEQPLTTEALLSYPAQRRLLPPYLGTACPTGAGRTGLPTRRHHPRVMHHSPGSLRDSAHF
uniref:Polynucleotide 5' hydroxyl kinase NOL9 n=1 Tax=Echinococcus granulosus TaxID=6210 RepID=A0A068WC35_ECHGR|nr:polynucleotide 5' hydroxyl kinase NOL9 [Echinococcus granulosus]